MKGVLDVSEGSFRLAGVVRCATQRFCCDLRDAPLQHPLDLGSPHCLIAGAGKGLDGSSW